jgi:UDP-N-acetylmuramate--alanine ligase
LLAVFQPHLYSRTRDLLPEFAEALGAADAVIVAGVYGAREEPIAGVDASLLSARVAAVAPRATVITEPNRQRVPVTLATVARAGDVVLIMGAGDIREAGEAYLRQGPGAGSMNTKEVSA